MKTSICMVTYNHENYIAEAIESVLTQQANFDYELVIGEDCSTDRTRQIVLDYTQKYPEKIIPLLRETNLGMQRNYHQTLQACRGDYIAMLEGDDYWIDSHKLQKQIDFLEANPAFSACFAGAIRFHEDDPNKIFYVPGPAHQKMIYTTEDLLAKNYIATCSIVFRNYISDISFTPFLSLEMLDWPLFVILTQFGPIGYLNETMAAYRLHPRGVWTGSITIRQLEAEIEAIRVIKEYLPGQYSQLVKQKVAKTYQLIALEFLREGRKRAARLYSFKSLAAIPLRQLPGFRWYLKRSLVLLLGSLNLPLVWVEKEIA